MKMKVTLQARVNEYADGGFSFSALSFEDMASQGYIACDTVEVEFSEPPRDVLVKGAVAAYREEQARIRAEAHDKVTALDDAIQKLLCLDHKPDVPA